MLNACEIIADFSGKVRKKLKKKISEMSDYFKIICSENKEV